MSEELRNKARNSYQLYEEKAQDYFSTLSKQLYSKSYVSNLKHDFKTWKRHHRKPFLNTNKKSKRIKHINYSPIQSLQSNGKLDTYLNRSISYIYMRDLGKALNEAGTQAEIKRTVERFKKQLLHSTSKAGRKQPDFLSTAWLYRWGEKEGVELTIIWLLDKLKVIEGTMPGGMNAGEATRKLMKLIAGVVIHQLDELDNKETKAERAQKLDRAIRLGFAYGLTYPFIDDLLDSGILTEEEKETFTSFIRETLLTGEVPELEDWTGPNQEFIQFVHTELASAFLYIKQQQTKEMNQDFFEMAYVFFESQERDRVKDLLDASYSNEELFIPIILKSASSRLIARSILPTSRDRGFDERTFYYGIYNQLADDFTDMFSDLEANQVTSYTYYLTYHESRPELINPFELYWTVVSHLIHNVYQSDTSAREAILSRAINSQKRFKKRVGNETYQEVMEHLSFGNKRFDRELQRFVEKADDVDFFDKLLRDHIITKQQDEEMEQNAFLNTAHQLREKFNQVLPISKVVSSPLEESIVEAANYSLENGGKRLRPILTWFLGVKEYNLDAEAITPLLKSVEYMHTASLIFDDLPSQDDAPLRRGQPTLHKIYDVATAELTGLFLTQKAVSEQATLETFSQEAVLRLIHYSSETITAVTRGQAMDLGSKGKNLTIEQLNAMCFYKTGIAFEASLVMPAILAEKSNEELQFLKRYAYHAGIAFQIKDDLLDVEGDSSSLGKLAGIDVHNNSANFVSVLGIDEAKKAMWEHYCLAMEEVEKEEHPSSFLKFFLDYIVRRDQ